MNQLCKDNPTFVADCNSITPKLSNRGVITDSTAVINEVSFSPITCITLNYNNCVPVTSSPVVISQTATTATIKAGNAIMEDDYTEVAQLLAQHDLLRSDQRHWWAQ